MDAKALRSALRDDSVRTRIAAALLMALAACGDDGRSVPLGPATAPPTTATPTAEASTAPPTTSSPTPTPKPIRFSGTGSRVIRGITKPDDQGFDFVLLHAKGNASGRKFAITHLGANDEELEELVNATDPYAGTVLLNSRTEVKKVNLKITAVGAWTLELRPSADMRAFDKSRGITGTGDDVLTYIGRFEGTAFIKGNAAGRRFVVTAYSQRSPWRTEQLVNTTDPFDGSAPTPDAPLLIDVKAVGPWSISIVS